MVVSLLALQAIQVPQAAGSANSANFRHVRTDLDMDVIFPWFHQERASTIRFPREIMWGRGLSCHGHLAPILQTQNKTYNLVANRHRVSWGLFPILSLCQEKIGEGCPASLPLSSQETPPHPGQSLPGLPKLMRSNLLIFLGSWA